MEVKDPPPRPERSTNVPEDLSQTSPGQARRAARHADHRGAWTIAGDLPSSFRYAAQGLGYGFISQRNFRIHVVTGGVVFGLGLWLQLPALQLAVLVLTVAAVLVAAISSMLIALLLLLPPLLEHLQG